MHLLVSLLFVAVTLIEFAIILMVKRNLGKGPFSNRSKNKSPIKVHTNEGFSNNFENMSWNRMSDANHDEIMAKSVTDEEFTKKIDNATFGVFLFSYFIFNCIYWAIYLTNK